MNKKPKEVKFLMSYYERLLNTEKAKITADKKFLEETTLLVENANISAASIKIVCDIFDISKPIITKASNTYVDPCSGGISVRSISNGRC